MKSGGKPGNQNAANGKDWKEAIRYALANYEDDGIERGHVPREIARVVVKRALEGDMYAIREIGDRLDGKPTQAIRGENRGNIILQIAPADASTL